MARSELAPPPRSRPPLSSPQKSPGEDQSGVNGSGPSGAPPPPPPPPPPPHRTSEHASQLPPPPRPPPGQESRRPEAESTPPPPPPPRKARSSLPSSPPSSGPGKKWNAEVGRQQECPKPPPPPPPPPKPQRETEGKNGGYGKPQGEPSEDSGTKATAASLLSSALAAGPAGGVLKILEQGRNRPDEDVKWSPCSDEHGDGTDDEGKAASPLAEGARKAAYVEADVNRSAMPASSKGEGEAPATKSKENFERADEEEDVRMAEEPDQSPVPRDERMELDEPASERVAFENERRAVEDDEGQKQRSAAVTMAREAEHPVRGDGGVALARTEEEDQLAATDEKEHGPDLEQVELARLDNEIATLSKQLETLDSSLEEDKAEENGLLTELREAGEEDDGTYPTREPLAAQMERDNTDRREAVQRVLLANRERSEAADNESLGEGQCPDYMDVLSSVQPSDLAHWRENASSHEKMRPKLERLLRSRRDGVHDQWLEAAVRYRKQHAHWRQSLSRGKSAGGSRQRDRDRDREREKEQEKSARGGLGRSRSGSGFIRSELEEIRMVSQLQSLERLRTLTRLPAMEVDALERRVKNFPNQAGLIEDPVADATWEKFYRTWSEGEKRVFQEKLAKEGKNFRRIANALPDRSPGECVAFYYRHQKEQWLKKYKPKSSATKKKKGPGAQFSTTSALQGLAERGPIQRQPSEPTPQQGKKGQKRPHSVSGSDIPHSLFPLPKQPRTRGHPSSRSHWKKPSAGGLSQPLGSHVRRLQRSDLTSKDGRKARKRPWRSGKPKSLQAPVPLPRVKGRRTVYEESVSFTEAEKELFFEGLKRFGRDWRGIANYMKTRTMHAVRLFFLTHRESLGLQEYIVGHQNVPSSNGENALVEAKEDDDGAGTGETPQGEERQEQAQASEQMQVDPNVLQQLTMYPQVPPGYIPMPPFFMPGVAPGTGQAFLQQALQFFSHPQQQQHQEEGDGGQDGQTTTQEAGNGSA